jgi:hypothetical protein
MNNSTEDSPSFLGPHEGRELELMLAGKKHLSKFVFEENASDVFPLRELDKLVANGMLTKDERSERHSLPHGDDVIIRNLLYATAAEAWRIPAMRAVEDIYQKLMPGWRPDLERIIGVLLGYDSEDVELFLEQLSKNKQTSYDP